MLSADELVEGSTFILKLPDAAGTTVYWMQTLKGDVARHWYDIFRTSDWEMLRKEAPGVFLDPVPAAVAERTRKSKRCVVIQPHSLNSADLI